MTEAKQLVSLCTENHLTISSCESQEKLWMWIIVCLLRATQVRVPGKKNQQEESIVLLLLKKRFVYMVFNVQVYLEMM